MGHPKYLLNDDVAPPLFLLLPWAPPAPFGAFVKYGFLEEEGGKNVHWSH